MTDTDLDMTCPHCSHHMDCATCVAADMPVFPGAISLCVRCANASIVTDEMTLRAPTPLELVGLNSLPEVRLAQAMLRDISLNNNPGRNN